MRLDTRQIPDEGLLLEGEESPAIFDLEEEGTRAVSPLRYRLRASQRGSELVLEGSMEAAFDLRCVRCLETFRKTVRLDPCLIVEEVENQGIVDLTDRIREDILLDLPDYPRCEQADSPVECPALARITPETAYEPTEISESSETDQDVWKALDELNSEEDSKS